MRHIDDPIERRRRMRERQAANRLAIVCVFAFVGVGAVIAGVWYVGNKFGKGQANAATGHEARNPESTQRNSGWPKGEPEYYILFNAFHDPSKPSSAQYIDPRKFDNDFRSNEVLARKTYVGKLFIIEGPVSELTESDNGITLLIGHPNFDYAYATGVSSNDSKVLAIRAGRQNKDKQSVVRLIGVCDGPITFSMCRLVEVKDNN